MLAVYEKYSRCPLVNSSDCDYSEPESPTVINTFEYSELMDIPYENQNNAKHSILLQYPKSYEFIYYFYSLYMFGFTSSPLKHFVNT